MTIAIWANTVQYDELISTPNNIHWVKMASIDESIIADCYFILQDIGDINFTLFNKPIFINAVSETLQSLHTSINIVRINGWPTFLKRNSWEIAGTISSEVKNVLCQLGKQAIAVKDVPGFVAARTVAMLINEAFFAYHEGVSSKKEIDIAMQLGTNYPLGPFDWGEKIGLQNIANLLLTLSKQDISYQPATALLKEANI